MNKYLKYQNYFDWAATTFCEDEVVNSMAPYWQDIFGNSSSRNHSFGWQAEEAVENARNKIAELMNGNPDEIIFTSGATEANNLAIKGYAEYNIQKNQKILSIATEHKCVIESLRYLRSSGYNVVFLPVQPDGLVDLNLLSDELKEAAFLSISYVNNETGVVQNMEAISKLCKENNVVFHTDATQAIGKFKINARLFDLISFSSHKIYGPKGIGALFVGKNPRIRLKAMLSGGGQERGLKSGTMPVPLCVGFAKAFEIADACIEKDWENAKKFHDEVLNFVQKEIKEIYLNGSASSKIPHILNLSIPYVEGESLMMKLNEFALSSGSACTSKSLEPSHVISAMHPEEKDLAHSSLRICFGRYTKNVDALCQALKKHIEDLRNLSPLYEMALKGIDLKSIKWKK